MYKRNILKKAAALFGVMIILINIFCASAQAFDRNLVAEFNTPDWSGSVIIQGHYNHNHQFITDDDDKKTYAYEYKRGLGQLALKYGNTDMYRDKESKPDISREKFDTAYYYKHGFEAREAVLSSAKLSYIQVSGNDYAVSDEMVYVTYVHAENGVIHRFQFWNCSDEEIETVLGSVKYPSEKAINNNDKAIKSDNKVNNFNIIPFLIGIAIVAIILISVVVAIIIFIVIKEIIKITIIRLKGCQVYNVSHETECNTVNETINTEHNTVNETINTESNKKEETAVLSKKNNYSHICQQDDWDKAAEKKQVLLGQCLFEDPIYGNSEWEKDYERGDVYRYSGYERLDWYCAKNGVTVEEAIKCVIKYREFCEEELVYEKVRDIKLSEKIYIRFDTIQKISNAQVELCKKNNINIIADLGEYVYYSLTQKLLYEDKRYYGYGSVDDAATIYERTQSVISKPYVLADFREFEGVSSTSKRSEKKLFHDESLAKWRLTIQLDSKRYWFLSVFFSESGEVEEYSLDYEGANDSHYIFIDEAGVRECLYTRGDEGKYLDEIFSSYIAENSGFALEKKISPFIINSFYF